MTRRKTQDKNIRKVFKTGSSYAITIPLEIVDKLKIRKGQKLVVNVRGKTITVKDWE